MEVLQSRLCDALRTEIWESYLAFPPPLFSAVAWRQQQKFRGRVLRYISMQTSPFIRIVEFPGMGRACCVFRSVKRIEGELGRTGVKWFHLYLRFIVPN